jgi:hypothetical protein
MAILRLPELGTFCWQQQVIDVLASPPASPLRGDRYIIDSSATGDWVGHDGEVAWCSNETGPIWTLDAPSEGWISWNRAASKYFCFDGSAWGELVTGGLEEESDPVFVAWESAYDHHENWDDAWESSLVIDADLDCLLTSGSGPNPYTETDPVFSSWQSAYDNHSNWDTAYSWGSHAIAGYLTEESDPVFSASVAAGITQGDVDSWNSVSELNEYTATTTDATPTTIASVEIPNGACVLLEARFIGVDMGNKANIAGYIRTTNYANPTGALAVVLTGVGNTYTSESIGAWNATCVIDGVNVRMQVTGAAATTINWKCTYKMLTVL